MKKFKGGLYADLSNYNTTLPNTEVLLNFFKSNPIGYRSGGMVRGIAGGNPTGMRVTGGFLANAQKFAAGDTVSAYYKKPTAQDLAWLPSGAKSEAAIAGASWRPGNIGQAKQQYKSNVSNTVFNEMMSNPDKYGLGGVALQEMKESGTVPLQYMHEDLVKTLSQTLQIPMEDVAEAMHPKLRESLFGGTRIEDPIETYGTKETEKIEDGIYQGTQMLPFVEDQVFTPLEQQEAGYGAPEGWDLKKDIELLKKGRTDEVSEHTKKLIREGKLPDIKKQVEQIEQEPKGYPGSRLEQRKFHTGPLPPSKADIEKAEKEKREKKYKNIDDYTKDTKNEKADSTTSLTSSIENIKKSDIVGKGEDAEFDIPDSRTSTEIYNTLSESSGITELLNQTTEANKKDREFIDTIGKEVYGKKGDKDAPAWAMPLMIAGLQMAASNNPDMLGAMAEGGIKGVEEYARATKEKREDAKDKIELDLKKSELKSKIFDRNMNIATINANIMTTAETLASQELQQINSMKLAKFKTESENTNFDKNLTKEIFFKNQEIDVELLKLEQRKDEFESLDVYNRQKLALEVLKAKNQEVQHDTEVNLKYRDMGKLTDVMISHEGIPKKAKIRSYYDYQENKFKTEFQGWSPLSSSEFTSFNDEIYAMAEQQLQEQIEDPKYAEKFEELVTKLWEEKMISLYGTAEDAEAALNKDLNN